MNTYRLDELATMRYGKLPPKEKLDSGCPIFTGYKVSGYCREPLYKEPMLLVVARGVGGTGDVKISPPNAWITNLSIVLDIDESLTDKYFLCQYLGQQGLKDKLNTGSAQAQITVNALSSYLVEIPDLHTQRRIASILSAYDDLIENNTRRIEILEEMARRLYEEWFVHFRFPGHEEVSFKESELGEIPEGWKPVAFSEVASFMNGFAFKPSHFTDDGLPVIKIKELKSGVTADTPRCSGEVKEKYLVKDGDVLFSWSAHLDAYIWRGGEGWLNQHLFKVDGVDGIPKSFLYFSLKEKMVDFRAKSMGTTMQHIKRSALNEVKFPMAAESLTSKFDDLVTPILNQVLLLQRKNGNLRAQRDLLLPKLVSGEIDVSDITMPDDKEVEAA
jgi:type I restriction enzyme S subunit